MAKGKLISELAQAAIKPKKPSARTAKELAEKEGKSKAGNAARIAKAGQTAIAPQRVAEVRRGASGVVGKNKTGLKPVSKMSKLEKQEFDFNGLTIKQKRLERDKLVRGEKTKYADYLKVTERLKVDPKLVGTKRPQNVKEARRKGPKGPVSLGGSAKVGGKGKSKLQEGLESVGKTKSPAVKKTANKPMSAAKKKRVEKARKEGSGALMREGLSDVKANGGKIVKKNAGGMAAMVQAKMAENKKEKGEMAKLGSRTLGYGGKVKKKMGGKVGKPKGVGCATRGYGKAMK